MKIGCAVGDLRNGPAAGRLHLLRPLGIECVEVQFGPDAQDAEDGTFIEKTREEIGRAKITVWSAHSPFGPEVDISSPRQDVRERGIAAIMRAARGCVDLGAGVIVVHCGDKVSEQDRPAREEALARSVESLKRVVDRCGALGVRVALENLHTDHLTSTAQELLGVVRQLPREHVGVCLDTGHAHIRGNAPEVVRAVADRIITVHIHDNDGSADQHRVPGSGTIDWQAVAAELRRSPYFRGSTDGSDEGGPLLFEVSGPGSNAEAISRLAAAGAMIRDAMAR